MTTGYEAPTIGNGEKTSQQFFVYHNNRWAYQCRASIYLEMPVGVAGSQSGWGDGTTQNAAKKTGSGWAGKTNETDYDFVNDVWRVYSRSSASGGIRYQTTPYTPGSDTYGATTTTRIDNSGDPWNASGFDSGVGSFITDQQGNPLFFTIGSASDGGTLSPKDGLLVGYDPLNQSVSNSHAQIESGFNRSASTNLDGFVFNDGATDYVGVLYSNSSSGTFKLAYHTTETTPSNYATGWIVEDIGAPPADSIDDHVCARSASGDLFGIVKGGNANMGYLITTPSGIDTATNNTTFTFTEVQDNMSRGVICIDETAQEIYIFYEQFAIAQSTINYKKQPLTGFSFTPSDIGTVFIENGTDDMENPTPPAHNVTSSMGFIHISCENNTLNNTWHNRIDISGSTGITVTATLGTIGYASQNTSVSISGVVDVNATLGTISYNSQNTVVGITGDIDVAATLGTINYQSQNAAIGLSGEVNVTATLGTIDYSSQNALVSVAGDIDVVSTLGTISYTSQNTIVSIDGGINVNATLGTINYQSNNATIELAGLIDVPVTLGTIFYTSNSAVVKTGKGQNIGNITAMFKPDTITVNFK